MRDAHPREVQYYQTVNGREPFTEWYDSLRDPKTQNRINRRLERIETGNLGEYKSVGTGVFELILDFGPGYRIYFGEVDNIIVLLLCGGGKRSQDRDIERAKNYWLQYTEAHQ